MIFLRKLLSDHNLIEKLFASCYRIRRVEEEIIRVYPSDAIKSPVHLSIGQEAVSVAVCHNLKKSDFVYGTYRSHALYLAKGGNIDRMMAELYGKSEGCGAGKAGSMHLIDTSCGMMGASAIVATSIPHAVGHALALKMQKKPAIVVCFLGDGATEEGVYHESLNFASLKKLPILFVCENNEFAIYSHIHKRQAYPSISAHAKTYGIPTEHIESGDIFDMYWGAQNAIEGVRQEQRPYFLEIATQRWCDHVGIEDDVALGLRPKEYVHESKMKDPMNILQRQLDDLTVRRLTKSINEEITRSIAKAERGEFPEKKETYTNVFA